jgi:hypothetical protein
MAARREKDMKEKIMGGSVNEKATAFTAFAAFMACALAFACCFAIRPAQAGQHRDPFVSAVNPGNKMCRDVFYMLHLPANRDLLKDNAHSSKNLDEIFDIPKNYPYIYLIPFGRTTEMNIRNHAPGLYASLSGRSAIFGYDYYASGITADLDMDGHKEIVYFIAMKGLPDFGKLYMQENGSPLVEALGKLDAVALMAYYNRTYVVTRADNSLKIFMLSTDKTGGKDVPKGQAEAEIMCDFAYKPK